MIDCLYFYKKYFFFYYMLLIWIGPFSFKMVQIYLWISLGSEAMVEFFLLPIKLRYGAHNSINAFFSLFRTQWYTNDLHMWGMAEQFFLSAASLYVCVLFGQNGTIDIVGVDALQGILKSRITWNEWNEIIKNKTSIILQFFTGLNI